MISGAIVGSTAQYMWHLYSAIRGETEHRVCEHCNIKAHIFIVAPNYPFTVFKAENLFL